MQSFSDKVAVVTGAASGIGKALSNCFASQGMHLVLADIELARFPRLLRSYALLARK